MSGLRREDPMHRLFSIRIVGWLRKLIYAIVAYGVIFAIAWVLRGAGVDVAAASVSTILNLAAVLYGARVFRTPDEPRSPARPTWQMTARPMLSHRVGVLFAIGAALEIPGIVLAAVGYGSSHAATNSIVSDSLSLLVNAFLAVLYLRSARHLSRRDATGHALVDAPTNSNLSS
jgi:hypothetical protein